MNGPIKEKIIKYSEATAMEFLLLFVLKPIPGRKLANSLASQVHLSIERRWKYIYSSQSDTCDDSAALLTAQYSTDRL